MQAMKFGVGQAVVRKEDDPLLRGRGRYKQDPACGSAAFAPCARTISKLMERVVYDSDYGQLLTASLTDYALPRADEVPPIVFETLNVRCPHNPLGVKGAGEAGAIGSCPAVMNAIIDALWRAFRISHIDMPATPERVWRTIEEAGRS
jgi:CO/xanthine dehydrogenase Mo-binding subunit